MKLNQIIALVKGIKSERYSDLSELNKVIQKPDLFSGFTKQYRKQNEESEDLPPESKKVQMTVGDVLEKVKQGSLDTWGIVAKQEYANALASANITIDGMVIAEDVPVTYLLFLEKQLTDLRTFIDNLPTLDPSEDWSIDVNSGLFKTFPVSTHRTKKIQRPLVLYPATPEHPAQTQLITEDVIAGYWESVKQSGALPYPSKQKLAARVESLLRAVKEARELANTEEEVATQGVATRLLDYLFPA